MIFRYRQINGFYYPIIDLRLSYGQSVVKEEALVDSGATISVFSLATADRLKVRVSKKDKAAVEGIGGEIEGFVKDITFKLAGKLFKAPVFFSDSFGAPYNLIGRQGIFTRFDITFKEIQHQMNFEPIS